MAAWTLPNSITMLRLALALPTAMLIATGAPWALWTALALLAIAELSDFLDGWLARRLDQISALGKILDPMADSLTHVTGFIALAALGWAPLWIVLLFALRDLAIAYLRLAVQARAGALAARSIGKWRAAMQGAGLFLAVGLHALWREPPDLARGLVDGVLWIAAALTVWSLVDYGRGAYRRLS